MVLFLAGPRGFLLEYPMSVAVENSRCSCNGPVTQHVLHHDNNSVIGS